jgi:hypothetical protein
MTTIEEKVLADLQDLGADSQDVADKLTQLGIHGKRVNTRGCPIYNYLKGKGHDIDFVGYDRAYIGELPDIGELSGSDESCALPSHISAFIRMFDEGMYPALIG